MRGFSFANASDFQEFTAFLVPLGRSRRTSWEVCRDENRVQTLPGRYRVQTLPQGDRAVFNS